MEKQINTMPDIKIFVVCHKPSYVPKNPYLYPIQVGTALASNKLLGMLHDDEGDNISNKNKTYCELTAQYWAWKNMEADYYGFFHYRRYFSFDPDANKEDMWGNIVYEKISEEAIREMKLNPEEMKELITKYDVISVKGRKYPEQEEKINIYEEYGKAVFQHREDLDKTLKVLINKYPKFSETVKEYMKSDVAHECNMFIMKKEIYKQYCSKNIITSEFVITDSFHGMCFSIIFHKPFIAVINEERGGTRFRELTSKLGLSDRIVTADVEQEKIKAICDQEIDYKKVDSIIEMEKERSLNWLKRALLKEKKVKLDGYDILLKRLLKYQYEMKDIKPRLKQAEEALGGRKWDIQVHRNELNEQLEKINRLEKELIDLKSTLNGSILSKVIQAMKAKKKS